MVRHCGTGEEEDRLAFRPLATLLEEHMYIDDGLVRKSLHSSNQPVQNKNTRKL